MKKKPSCLKVYLNKYVLLYLLPAAASYNHFVFNRQLSCEDIVIIYGMCTKNGLSLEEASRIADAFSNR